MLKATNLLATFNGSGGSATTITSVSLTCNTSTGPGAAATVWVRPTPALTGTNQIIVSAGALSGTGAANALITAPGSQVLNAGNSATGIVYTISLAATPSVGCVGLGTAINATFNFAHIVGTVAVPNLSSTPVVDIGITVASTLTASTSGLSIPSTINVTCVKNGSNYYPGAAQTVTVSSTATGGTPFSYDGSGGNLVAAWLTLNPVGPSGTATAGTPITFTVVAAAGCDALPSTLNSNTATTTIHLLNAPAAEQVITVTLTVSAPSASALVVSPSSVTVTCAKSGANYYPSYPQTLAVTAAPSTAFTVDTATNPYATWLTVNPTTGGTASTTAVQFTVQAAPGCGGFALNSSTTTTVHLLNAPATDKVFSVTLQVVPVSILTANPNPASLTYVKGSGTAGYVNVAIASSSNAVPTPFFTVNTATLPIWLRLDSSSGMAPQSLRFSSTTIADTLAPGTYTASVVVSVSGYGDLDLPVSMLLTNKSPQLTVEAPPAGEICSPASATTFCIPWVIGQGLPTPSITAISTDTPVSYTATTGGLLAPVIPTNQLSGLAYSFGTPINISFNPQAFAAAQPGNILTGTVTLTWGNPVSTVVVTFDVTVQSPGATISSASPASLPVSVSGSTYTVALTGTGFVTGTNPSQATRVGVVTTNGSPMTFDTNIQTNIINQSNITLTITVPSSADAAIPFAGGPFNIGVCNPVAGSCTTATSQATLTIGTNPIIQAVTSSSSLLQNQSVSIAPYDMISIFGANFCPNCTSTQVLTGTPDPVTLTYQTALPFDGSHSLSIRFQNHSGNAFIANAPILFATNGQINLMVPSGVTASGAVDIFVSYGSGNFGSNTQKTSAAFTATIVPTDPGIFTIGADGQGSGAALDMNYNLISATNPAGIRTGANNSDIISLYMTGLGAPDDTNLASNTTAAVDAGFVYYADCVSTSSYLTSFNAAQIGLPIATLDGTLIIPSVLNTGRLVPCISTLSADVPTVSIGGATAVVKYAGWVPGTIAGLYQVNIQLPINTPASFTTESGLTLQSITAPVQLPITLTSNTVNTQSGVSLWVAPRLLVTGPSSLVVSTVNIPNTVSATVGVSLPPSHNVLTATGGTGNNPTFAVTSGLLPAGLSIGATTGLISGVPAAGTAGTYTVTVTAADAANVPVTGSVTFVVTVAGGLFMTNTVPSMSTFGTANASVATVTATGGIYPYIYTVAIPSHSLPAGLAINAFSGVISTTTLTPAGSYNLAVSALDSTTGTQLAGLALFTNVVNLDVVANGLTAGANGVASTIATIAATGNTGTVTYALDPTTAALSWVTFDTSTGILAVTTGSQTYTHAVTVTATDGTAPTDAAASGTGSVTFTMVVN